MFDQLRRIAFSTLGASLLSLRADYAYRSLPKLLPTGDWAALPSLSIIVPARDEADNLRRLLPSLTSADYPGALEIIVVDDNSTDETAAVAREHATSVVRLNTLPSGWLGKTYACQSGASAARGEWLLFVDADTVHKPNGGAAAVAFAVRNQLDGLSLWLRNEFIGVTDGITLMVAFAALFAGRAARDGVLNGQFILLRKDVYWKSGGHAAVALEAMEDLALGRRLQQQGYEVPLLRGEEVAAVRMYHERMAWWSGLTRWGARSLRWSGAGALLTALLVTIGIYPLLMLAGALSGRLPLKWAVATWLMVTTSFLPWARRFGKAWWAVLAPVGALMVQTASTWGLIRDLTGCGAPWKGRTV